MQTIDWIIVFVLNGAVIGAGFYLARGTETSSQWFLGSRALPWWAIGLSMFATNVDSADLVSVTGNTYNQGLHILTVYTLGSAIGGLLAAFFVVPAIYRAGFFTNAEYLEARFGPAARVLSALIQIQYRSSMLGMMIWSVYLLLIGLEIVGPQSAWALIVAMVIFSGLYTAWGGLKSVVWTDAAQSIVMMIAGIVIFVAVWNAVGGWSGMLEELATADQRAAESGEYQPAEVQGNLPAEQLHEMHYYQGKLGATSPYVVALAWIVIGSGYWTVNHTQTMRLMGARSVWDMKMAAIFGVAVSLPLMVTGSLMGLMGRALHPALEKADTIYPILAREFLGPGLKGLVVAGVVAAAISTFDSMGSALSAIFTRDIYARLIKPDRDDHHYVVVGRWSTVAILTLGFLYLPFIIMQKNMITAFTTLIPVFVTPLFTIYVLGVTTRVHRSSGLIGLACGSLYGVIALYDRTSVDIDWMPPLFVSLPVWFTGRWEAFLWSLLFTGTAMLLVTMIRGKQPVDETIDFEETGWLQRSREQLPALVEHPFKNRIPALANPIPWAVLLMLGFAYIVFGVFW